MERILIAQVIVDSGLMILIWLVQLIMYPCLCFIEDKEFIGWHKCYSRMISLIVVPLMLAQAGIEIVYALQQDIRWPRVLIIALIWISTVKFSVPCHRRLHWRGKNLQTINRLIMTNWLRTVFWSILFLETVMVSFTL